MQTRLWAMVAIVLSLAAPGCAASGNRPQSTTTQTMPAAVKTVEVTDGSGQQLTREVTMSVGDVLRVTLGANHSTPFWWSADSRIGDSTVIEQTNHEYVAGATTGGPGTETWTFEALKVGATTIAIDETNKTSPGRAPLRTFTAKVTVQ